MGKKIIKYITALSGILFLSSTDIGEDTRINLGPVQLNPSKFIEPIENVYQDLKDKVTSYFFWNLKKKILTVF